MKAVYRWAGFSLVVLASGFFIVYVVDNWSNLPSRILERPVLATLTVAPFGYLAGFLLTAIAWRILLGAMGETPRLTQVLSILLISQIAKYLPGNFGHHVGRVLMAQNAGLASGLVVLTTILEAGGVMLAAVGVGFLALMVDSTALLGGVVEIPGPGKLLAFGLAVTAVPLAAILLVKRFSIGRFQNILGIKDIQLPDLRALFACYILYVANFLVLGAILYLLVSTLTDGKEGHFWLLTGVFAVTWVAGFFTPGAPGGLGVREAILVAALDPVYGSGIALSLAFGMRMITTVGDAIGFLAGLALRHWIK